MCKNHYLNGMQKIFTTNFDYELLFESNFSAMEALDHLSVGDLTRIAIEGAKELQNGQSLESIIARR